MDRTEGHDALRRGSRLFGRAARVLATGPSQPERETADGYLREAMTALRSAMNWLEDTPDFELAHQRLDQVGKLARDNWPHGCRLVRDGTNYSMECPVALAHNRVGLSIGYIIKRSSCSICGADPVDCLHITGEEYEGEMCIRVIEEADMLEVSLVGRPAQPDARIESMGVAHSDIRKFLGDAFTPGIEVTCDRCLKPCKGVTRPFETSGHGVWDPPVNGARHAR